MGCGGSKEDVATGNTIIHRPSLLLLRRKSEPPKDQTSFAATPVRTDANPTLDNASNPVVEKLESNKETEQSLAPATVTKELTEPLDSRDQDANEEEEGKLIVKESPEEYFSSRKDVESVSEVVAEAVVAGEGAEYYSPDRELNNVSGKDEKDHGMEGSTAAEGVVNVEAPDEGKDLLGSGQEIAPKEEDGKLSSMDSAELKEAILVEEKKEEGTNIGQKSLGEGEVTESK